MPQISNWARSVYLVGIVLALVLVIPTIWFPLQLGKIAVFVVCLLGAVLLFAAGRRTHELSRPGLYAALAVFLLPAAYLLSMFFSTNRSVALLGYNGETDTILFTLLGALAFLCSYIFFRTLKGVRLLLGTLFASLIAAAVFQWVAIVFGTHALPFQAFENRSVNLVGKWNDLGLMVGLLSTLLLVWVEMLPLSRMRRIVAGVFGAGLLVLLGLIHFTLVWWMLLAAGFATGFLKFLSERGTAADRTWKTMIPWFSVVAGTVSVLFLLFGTQLNAGLTTVFPVTSLEVRPSYATTMQIVTDARGGSILRTALGTGPATFGEEWLMHKPSEVNQSPFWNLDFNVGFSVLVTALVSVGIVGALAWLIPLLLVLLSLMRVARLRGLSVEEHIASVSLGLSSLFLWGTVFFYVPSQNIILLAFVLSGATVSYLWSLGREEHAHVGRGWKRLIPVTLIGLMLVCSVGETIYIVRRAVAESYTQQSIALLQTGDIAGAQSAITRAVSVEKNTNTLRVQTQTGLAELQQIANGGNNPSEAVQARFKEVLESTITTGNALVLLNKNDYRSYLVLAQVYDLLASLKVQGAYQTAEGVYSSAVSLNPSNPELWLALARLEAGQGNKDLTARFLTQALTLKQNYTDAILMVVQVNVANKDIKGAIQAAELAVQSAPGVASIWFELGLLHYSNGDMEGAIPALEKATTLVQNYANAQYFLGLSYYQVGKKEEAMQLFTLLRTTNPDNAEVVHILSNMEAGKPAFDNATPPGDTPPQNRATAPISE